MKIEGRIQMSFADCDLDKIVICPEGGMVFGDKAYALKSAQIAMKANGCHSGAILKNNMKQKNKDKDRWLKIVFRYFAKLNLFEGVVCLKWIVSSDWMGKN